MSRRSKFLKRSLFGLPRSVVEELTMTLTRLVAIGLLAIGVSSVIAFVMGAFWGKAFVSGDAPGVTYTSSRCADLFEYAPSARTCEQAATEHHFEETVAYRAVAGVLGVIMAAGYWALRRRRPPRQQLLPPGFEATIGAGVFGLVGLLLLGQGVGELFVPGHAGAGEFLSGGMVSGVVAATFAVSLHRTLIGG